MKKLLIGLATVATAASASADVKFGGSTSLNYTSVTNGSFTKDNNSDGWVMWNVLDVNAAKGEKLSWNLKLKHVNKFGTGGGVTPSAGDTNTTTLNQDANLFYVQEATGWVKTSENGSLTFGRSGLELNSGELISKRSFNDSNIAFDGIRYVHDADYGRLGLSYSMSVDSDNFPTSSSIDGLGKVRFTGLSYTFKNLPDSISNLELHYVNAAADNALATAISIAKQRTWIGLNIKGEAAGVDYRFNYDSLSAKSTADVSLSASAMDLEVGYAMPSMMDSRVALHYHADSPDKDNSYAYDGLYYDTHKYAGMMEVVGWGNLNDVALSYSMKPYDGSTLILAYHIFSRVEDSMTAGFGTTGTNTDIGTEIDLAWMHKYDSGLYVNLEYGMFSAGDYVKDQGNDETISRFYVETGFSF